MVKIIKLNKKTDVTEEITLPSICNEVPLVNCLSVYLFVCEFGFQSFGTLSQALTDNFDKFRNIEKFKDICYNIHRSGGMYDYSNDEYFWTIEKKML